MAKNVALVLSSGGARGIAHIGVIEQLLEMGYKITSVSGTSIGSLIGGLFAVEHLNDYKNWIASLDSGDVFSLMDFQLNSAGFIKGKKVFNHMKQWLSEHNIEDLSIPYTAVATDIINRKEIVFDKGSLVDAIRASVAVPGFISPLYYNDKWLFDGGVVNPLPLNRVKRKKGDILVAVNLNAFVENQMVERKNTMLDNVKQFPQLTEIMNWYQERFGNDKQKPKKLDMSYLSLMNQMFDMMQEQISDFTLQQTPPDILINIPRDACSTFEFHKSKEIIEIGKKEALVAVEKFQNKS